MNIKKTVSAGIVQILYAKAVSRTFRKTSE